MPPFSLVVTVYDGVAVIFMISEDLNFPNTEDRRDVQQLGRVGNR